MRMQKPWRSVTCLPAKWKRLFSGTGKRQSLLDIKKSILKLVLSQFPMMPATL